LAIQRNLESLVGTARLIKGERGQSKRGRKGSGKA